MSGTVVWPALGDVPLLSADLGNMELALVATRSDIEAVGPCRH